jgi:hypothetical protein
MEKPVQSSQYPIRYARPGDLPVLPVIERAAAERFHDTPYAYLIDDGLVTEDVNLDHEYAWVVVDQKD